MKVLHYVSGFSLPSETFIYDLINNLEETGIDNYILTHARQLEDERPFSKIKIIDDNASFCKKVYSKLFESWSIRNKIDAINYIKDLNPSLIHAHFGPNGIKIYKLIKKYNLNIPLVVSFHGMDINVLPKQDKVYLFHLLKMGKGNNILFTSPSKFLKNKMISLGVNSETIKVIPNAFNSYFENAARVKDWVYGDTLKLLNIGRFEEVKGQQYLIEAFSNVLKIYPNIILTIIGYGSLEQELRNLCESFNITDKVEFLKQVKHSQLPKIISEHDIYIQPSIIAGDGAEESLGVSTIEAQVCGLPAIISNVGGLKEIVIDNVTGRLVEQKNIKSLEECIHVYIKNPDYIKEQSINAVIESKKRFNKNIIINKLINDYDNLVKG